MIKQEDRRIRLTKRMLKDSLLEMLKNGAEIHRISIRDLCERADINRSTFYKYYGSQYDLLKEMEDEWLRRVESSINNMGQSYDLHLLDILHFMHENIELSRLLCNSNVDPLFPQRIFSLPSIKRLIVSSLPAGKPEHIIDYIQEFFVSGAYSIIKKWLNKDDGETPEEMVQIMMHMFNENGLLVGAGIKRRVAK